MDQDSAGGRAMVSVRLTKAEQDALRVAAERRGESVSSFVRRVSLGEAGVRRTGAIPAAGPTRTVTIGAALHYTDSGRLVSSPLVAPSTTVQFDTTLSAPAGDPSGDFSQRALHGVREVTDRYEDDAEPTHAG